MPESWKSIPSFGGGINLAAHPVALNDDEWTWCDGWLARNGAAEVMPGYDICNAGGWPTAGYVVGGAAFNPFGYPKVLLLAQLKAGSAPILTAMDSAGATTNYTCTGGGCAVLSCIQDFRTAFLNGYLVATFGQGTTALGGGLTSSVIRWNGGANYTAIVPAKALFGLHLVAGAGHLVLANAANSAALTRVIYVSGANDESVWDLDISNDADEIVLGDSLSGITALLNTPNGQIVLWTRFGAYALQPTGGIPPFTLQQISAIGAIDFQALATSYGYAPAGNTPFGPIIRGPDNIYLGDQPIATKIWPYVADVVGKNLNTQIMWHEHHGRALLTHRTTIAGVPKTVVLQYSPLTQAWSRRVVGIATAAEYWDFHACPHELDITTHWLATPSGAVIREKNIALASPTGGEYVDTKDFGSPNKGEYDAIKVDWEPLTNATTDALEVLAYTRNDLSPSTLGSAGWDTSAFTFQSLGTLAAGESELAIRRRGKYVRFRFKQSSGRVRIRGFHLRVTVRSDR